MSVGSSGNSISFEYKRASIESIVWRMDGSFRF